MAVSVIFCGLDKGAAKTLKISKSPVVDRPSAIGIIKDKRKIIGAAKLKPLQLYM
jgi:hypothetical protein